MKLAKTLAMVGLAASSGVSMQMGGVAMGQETLLQYQPAPGGLAPWTVVSGDWEVKDGALVGGQKSSAHFVRTGDLAWTDYAFEARVRLGGSTDPKVDWLKAYLFFRLQDERNFYRFGIHGDAKCLDLCRCEKGNYVVLGSVPFTAVRDQTCHLRVEAKGARLQCFVDGKLLIDRRDPTFLAGAVGLGVHEDSMVTAWQDIRVTALAKTGTLAVEVKRLFLTRKTLTVQIDAADVPGPAESFRATVSLTPTGGNQPAVAVPVDGFDKTGFTTKELSVRDLPGGKYDLQIQLLDAQGKGLASWKAESILPGQPAWLGSTAGVSDEVLPPWTPLKVQKAPVAAIECWGRRYEFDRSLWPTSVTTANRSVLAQPIVLAVRVDGEALAWEPAQVAVESSSDAKVLLRGASRAGDLRLEGVTAIEYDGISRMDLRLTASRPLRLEQLTLEIPFRAEAATLFHFWPGRWGSAYNSGALPADGLRLPFKPFLWLGNEDGGLGFIAESAKDWSNANADAVLNVVREGDRVVLRVSIIDAPIQLTPDRPLVYTLGFQATPVKAIPRDWHEWRICHAGSYDLVDRLYRPSGALEYPAEGNLDPRQGTLEAWVVPTFDPNVEVSPQDPGRGVQNRDFLMIVTPQSPPWLAGFYWNIDDRGMRFYVKKGEQFPIIVGSRAVWKQGEAHHLALTWGSEIRIYLDGKLVASKPFTSLLGESVPSLPAGSVIRFGGSRPDFVLGRLRISSVPREQFDLSGPPAADAQTLLLDILDDSFTPDGHALTHATKAAPQSAAGGLPSRHTQFEATPFGKGLALCPTGPAISALDHLAQMGVKTLVFHEHWTDVQNYTMVGHGEQLKRLVAECHQRGIKLLVYYGYEMSSIAPEWDIYGHECLVKAVDAPMPTSGYPRQPKQHANIVCYNSPWQDFIADGIQKTIAEYGIDGVYLDGTIEPWGCPNYLHGCGYQKADGSWAPTYPVFAVRNLMKRLYTMATRIGGLVNPHQSTCCTSPTLGFSHSYWDGEQFGNGELAGDPLKLLPIETFRAEFMGHNWGVPAEFLVYERPPNWTMDDALAFSMLHDVCVRPGGIDALERIAPIWNAWSSFGVQAPDCVWHPYWRNQEWVTAAPDGVKVSLYSRGAKGCLAVVSNLGATDAAASVRFDLARLGLAGKSVTAKDALTGEALPVSDGQLRFPLARLRMRLVRME